MHLQDHFLSSIPDPTTYPHDTWPFIELTEPEMIHLEEQPTARIQTRLPYTFSMWKKKTIRYAVLFWRPISVHYTFDMQDVEADIGAFTDDNVRGAIDLALKGLQPPKTHRSTTIAFGSVFRKDFYVVCHSDVRVHEITGWSDLIPADTVESDLTAQ